MGETREKIEGDSFRALVHLPLIWGIDLEQGQIVMGKGQENGAYIIIATENKIVFWVRGHWWRK